MSHPPETSFSSRELADDLFVHYDEEGWLDAEGIALIDAWVRVREAEARLHEVTSNERSTFRINELESALATARKQLEEKS